MVPLNSVSVCSESLSGLLFPASPSTEPCTLLLPDDAEATSVNFSVLLSVLSTSTCDLALALALAFATELGSVLLVAAFGATAGTITAVALGTRGGGASAGGGSGGLPDGVGARAGRVCTAATGVEDAFALGTTSPPAFGKTSGFLFLTIEPMQNSHIKLPGKIVLWAAVAAAVASLPPICLKTAAPPGWRLWKTVTSYTLRFMITHSDFSVLCSATSSAV
mmetsp:Transcript_122589/g.194173  ORF Transcript_122589/g.194173 Transcript_122589/m.194173 type:complete len:221 (+) Transcript_122589:536-1198(+)